MQYLKHKMQQDFQLKLGLFISWILSFASLNLSIIPTILSTIASMAVLYKSYLEIKKLTRKDDD